MSDPRTKVFVTAKDLRNYAAVALSNGTAAELLPTAIDWADAASAEIDVLRRALHEIAEEWAGAECGEPKHAQEAYAIALAKRMYLLAAEALRKSRYSSARSIA